MAQEEYILQALDIKKTKYSTRLKFQLNNNSSWIIQSCLHYLTLIIKSRLS